MTPRWLRRWAVCAKTSPAGLSGDLRAVESWLYQDAERWGPTCARSAGELVESWDSFTSRRSTGLTRAAAVAGIELQSILREKARINALPAPDETLFVQEALALRHSRLEREHRELFFLQEEAKRERNPLASEFDAASAIHYQALSRVTRALQQIKSLFRDQ